jgi:hypothetical protein
MFMICQVLAKVRCGYHMFGVRLGSILISYSFLSFIKWHSYFPSFQRGP